MRNEISDYAYAGKAYGPVTGMYNYGFRDYTPQVARFSTVDPIRDGANWFAYCEGDPVNKVDLWGLESFANGETRLSETITTPVTGIGLVVTVAAGTNSKVDVYVGATNANLTPALEMTTTVTYATTEGSKAVTSKTPDYTDGEGSTSTFSTSPAYHGEYNTTAETLGVAGYVALPEDIEVKDITDIKVDITLINSDEQVSAELSAAPSALKNK